MSSPDEVTSFLTYYVQSLAERTRVEKAETKYGFDWIIYNLALAEDLVPVRLPFLRAGGAEISKTKTEAELGVDFAFLSKDGQALAIFALKDEPLTNSTWKAENFDSDLRMAVAPDLTARGLENVKSVRVILAYNKDEDAVGVQLFENLARALGTRVGDHVTLNIDRWNLTIIVEKVKASLLNPSLLPQSFFSLFSYIVAQAADVPHGSPGWEQHLLPTWHRFLNEVLAGPPSERTVRLVSVALLILQTHGQRNPTFSTGFIDLIEWAMLKLWQVHAKADKQPKVRSAIVQIWRDFYLTLLGRFYWEHRTMLLTEDSMDTGRASFNNYLGGIGAAYIAFWHLGRLGILVASVNEAATQTTAKRVRKTKANDKMAQTTDGNSSVKPSHWTVDLLVGFVNANPAASRPLLDIHHIELFLVWNTLIQEKRHDDIYQWLGQLESRLAVRRAGIAALPFLEGHNSLERVLEHVTNGEKPLDFMEGSSYLLTMLLEICLSLRPESRRDELLGRITQRLVKNLDADGKQFGSPPLDLVSWQPPEDWARRVLQEVVTDGVGISVGNDEPAGFQSVAERFLDFIGCSRQPLKLTESVPRSVYFLACIKYASPLPPEFWREQISAASTQKATDPE